MALKIWCALNMERAISMLDRRKHGRMAGSDIKEMPEEYPSRDAPEQRFGSPVVGTGGRLLRRTFLISLLLVSLGLVASGALELYFSYREQIQGLGEVQREIAQSAAFKIHQFVQDIEKTMRSSTQTQEIVTAGLTQNYRFELIKLLKITPAITEAVAINEQGREEIKVSRVRTTLPDDLKDRSAEEAFVKARSGKSFFGKVYFVRKSEPYMTIAVPIERFAGDVIGVLISEVNLKYIWDVVSAIKVGTAGYAYVVSGEGDLIAHPDISYVLEKRSLKDLGQVKAALTHQGGPLGAQPNLIGQKVLPAYAPIADLGWAVLIERPVSEAYAPLYASTLRTALLLLVGLGMAVLASFLIGRRVVRPIEILRRGAARIGSGDLNHRLEIKTGDELQALADEFNKMTAQLQESYSNLEHKVEDRTQELSESLEQQTATSEILRVIASSRSDIQPVLDAVAERAARLCEADDAQIRLSDGTTLRLTASFGSLARSAENVPIHRDFVPGRAMIERQTVHVHDLAADVQKDFPGSKDLQQRFGTRTMLATPLLLEGAPIGVINVRRTEVRPFTDKHIGLLKTFADQAVIAIESVRLFREIQEKNDQLENANRHKSQFLANVSHELRTPLNSIIGFTRLVLRKTEGQIEKLQNENLQKVLISSEHLLNLINGLLDLAKIEAGRMEVYAETFNLNDIIRVAISTVEPLLKNGRVRLVAEVDPNIPPLKTDRDKLKQVVLNLLSNSVKFTEAGQIKIAATRNDGRLTLTVSDTGIGMKKEVLDYIFDEFRQADMSSTRRYGGTGLGLAIVKKFIELMGGEIKVESEVGKGSTFTITLPIELRPHQ
ncbi:MAG TPA: ATP-binding protein [Candidatus Binatia bacterium]|nr:ATP-binding protein [Candidatus Binatia bacterium]